MGIENKQFEMFSPKDMGPQPDESLDSNIEQGPGRALWEKYTGLGINVIRGVEARTLSGYVDQSAVLTTEEKLKYHQDLSERMTRERDEDKKEIDRLYRR